MYLFSKGNVMCTASKQAQSKNVKISYVIAVVCGIAVIQSSAQPTQGNFEQIYK